MKKVTITLNGKTVELQKTYTTRQKDIIQALKDYEYFFTKYESAREMALNKLKQDRKHLQMKDIISVIDKVNKDSEYVKSFNRWIHE